MQPIEDTFATQLLAESFCYNAFVGYTCKCLCSISRLIDIFKSAPA